MGVEQEVCDDGYHGQATKQRGALDLPFLDCPHKELWQDGAHQQDLPQHRGQATHVLGRVSQPADSAAGGRTASVISVPGVMLSC